MLQESQQPTVVPSVTDPQPKNWWQWVVMYPALFLSLAGNISHIPNLAAALQLGVPPHVAQEMREQADAWKRNEGCLGKQRSVAKSQADELAISVTLCPTGDMLVSIDDADPQNVKHVKLMRQWVQFNTQPGNSISELLMPRAIAATLNHTPQLQYSPSPATEIAQLTVICQKSLGQGRILRRLKREDGRCFDEIVNTFTGEVISQTPPTQCNSDCSGG